MESRWDLPGSAKGGGAVVRLAPRRVGWRPGVGRRPTRPFATIGRCCRCGVACLGPSAERQRVGALLLAHERYCPGGTRHRETWAPLQDHRPR